MPTNLFYKIPKIHMTRLSDPSEGFIFWVKGHCCLLDKY